MTADVDVTVEIDAADAEELIADLEEAGFVLRAANARDLLARTRVLPFLDRKNELPLDVVFAGPGLEKQFLERVRRIETAGGSIPVPSPEDLLDPELRAEIRLGIDLLERSIGAIDVHALGRAGGDPWLYFYEDFLAKYDPRLRNDRGVYYTPVEVIRCQCRLVRELLRHRFDRDLDFADVDVVVLDPGAGTGAYLLAAFQMGSQRTVEIQGPGALPGRASLIARNFHAFEILVGPYAVAHLRLTQAIQDAGGEVPEDGVHVYLTDTLESPHAKTLGKLPFLHQALADEHARAQRVKAETRVLVCGLNVWRAGL